MLVHEGHHRSSRIDLWLAAILSFVAGAANSAGFYAFGYFSANMTGNVTQISDQISLGAFALASAFGAIVVLFICGAFVASLFIQFGKYLHWTNIYALTLLAEALVLLAIGCVDLFYLAAFKGLVIVGMLSFTMGIQNAASTRISGNRVRTTHVSGAATDIGVNLAFLWHAPNSEARRSLTEKLQLHLTTIAAFLVGGVAGVIGYTFMEGGLFLATSVLLFVLSARYLNRKPGRDGPTINRAA